MSLAQITYTGVTTTVTTGMAPINGGSGSRTQTTYTVNLSGAAQRENPAYPYTEWVPPLEAAASSLFPTNASPVSPGTGIIPGSQYPSANGWIITTPPSVAALGGGYYYWDTSVHVEDERIIYCPLITTPYGRTGDPIFVDCGTDLAAVPTWLVTQNIRWVAPSLFTAAGLFSDAVPTDSRAVAFPYAHPYVYPVRPPALYGGLSRVSNGWINPNTNKLYASPLTNPAGSPVESAIWWGIPSFRYQFWGQFYTGSYSGATPAMSWTLYGVDYNGGVSSLASGSVAFSDDGAQNPGDTEHLFHLDTTVTASATIPATCCWVYYVVSRDGTTNDYAPFVGNTCFAQSPSLNCGLLQSPETGCGPALGYLLGMN